MIRKKLTPKFLLALNEAAEKCVDDAIQEYLNEGHSKEDFYKLCTEMPDWLDAHDVVDKYLKHPHKRMWYKLDGYDLIDGKLVPNEYENDMTGFTTNFTYFYSLKKCREWHLYEDSRYHTYFPLFDFEGNLLNHYFMTFFGVLEDSDYEYIEG